MNNRNRELVKNTIILSIGQLVPKFLALIVLPILTSYLSTSEYGTYDLVISFAGLIIPIITIQIQQAVFRYLLASFDVKEKTGYVSDALLYVSISSVVLLPFVYAILKLLEISNLYAVLICILYVSEAAYVLFGQIIRGLGYNLKYSYSVIIYSIVNLIFTFLLIVIFHMGLYGVIVSITIAYICSDIYMILASGMIGYINIQMIDIHKLKELVLFSLPIVPSSIALWVVNLSDRLVILHFLGSSANGIYAVSNKIPTIYNTAYSIFNLSWTETASKVSDDGNPSEYYSNLFHTLYEFLIGAMLLVIACTRIVFKILVKGDFTSAIYQVPILYFGVFFNSLVNFYSGIYIALKKTKQVGASSALGAIINIVINVLCINKIGLYAASLSTVISFFIIAIYRACDINKTINIVYDKKSLIIGMLCFGLSSVLMYKGGVFCSITCFLIAITYNYLTNLIIIKKVFYIIIKKLTNAKRA